MENIPSTTIVIFGASGDLTWRKLIPALYNSFKKGRLSEHVNVVGFARRPYTDETFRAALREGCSKVQRREFRCHRLGKVRQQAALLPGQPGCHG